MRFSAQKKALSEFKLYLEKQKHIFPYHFSLVVEDLHPGIFCRLFGLCFSFAYQAHKKVAAASIIKVPILACSLLKAKRGEFDLAAKVRVTSAQISGGSGIIKGLKLPQVFSNQDLISLMIERSDNTATNLIIKELKIKYLNRCFQNLKLKETSLSRFMADYVSHRKGKENFTSAFDLARILQRIYEKKAVSQQYDTFMLKLLGKNSDRSRLGRYLPEKVFLAHKTGLERGVVHDGGVVLPFGLLRRSGYVIVVMCWGVKNYHKAKVFIGRLSQRIYEFYQRYRRFF